MSLVLIGAFAGLFVLVMTLRGSTTARQILLTVVVLRAGTATAIWWFAYRVPTPQG